MRLKKWIKVRETHIAFDTDLQRPGAPQVQKRMQGAPWHVASCFPSETWLPSRTKNMKLYELNEETIDRLVALSIQATVQQKAG